MDISSLLSPADSPADETPPPTANSSTHASPIKRHGRPSIPNRQSSGLSQHYSPSPRPGEQSIASIAAHNAAAEARREQQIALARSNPNSPYPQVVYGSATTSQPAMDLRHGPMQAQMQRHGSTPQMETLADLASMQRYPTSTSGQNTPTLKRDSTPAGYTLETLPRPPLPARSSNEIVMTDPATQEQRTYRTSALSEHECTTLGELGNHLVKNPFDYATHVSFIQLLQHGFASHVGRGIRPHDYELALELRQARKNMDAIFPLGERLWLSWLDDEIALARNTEDRLHVMELFIRAVSDEPSSVKLWRKYGDYAYHLWVTSSKADEGQLPDGWTSQDLKLGKEYFTWGPMLRVWDDAVSRTRFRLNDSHEIWDQYLTILIQDLDDWPDKQKVVVIEQKFAERLKEAHATWEGTFQMFGQFISRYDAKNYEAILSQMSRDSGGRTAYRLRESMEARIKDAEAQGDESAEYNAYKEYLDWEVEKKGVFSFRMINSLYERATVRFPSAQTIWVEYIDFLLSDSTTPDFPVMGVIERATRHCPWSGDLWAHRLLTMEVEGKPFAEMEKIKHRATSTGLLDVGGMEELMKVYVAWCGGLRRRAFDPGASDEELDVAEVAITSALEHVKKIGSDKYGDKFMGDPHYRLERIYIKFLMQKGDVQDAREHWKLLQKTQGNSYNFWYRFYIWEMVIWAKYAMPSTVEPDTQLRTPELATRALTDALAYVDSMDQPEELLSMYLNHCEHHESVSELHKAVIRTREVSKQIEKRRHQELAAAPAGAAIRQAQAGLLLTPEEPLSANGKRKREIESTLESTSSKKGKPNDSVGEEKASESLEPKRDREHTTIIVEGISANATEAQIGNFFRDCGTIKSVKVAKEKDTQVATIEFEAATEAEYAIFSKNGKDLTGSQVKVSWGAGTTVYVTNYPPEADKAYLRDLFKDTGEIIDLRLPSLKANSHRRFAYVQFANPDQAHAATQRSGVELKGKGGIYKLSAAISDPNKAATRHGPQAEGREVFVRNVSWFVTEEEVKALFQDAGDIQSVRIPRNEAGKSKAIAFVVYKTKDEAEQAVKRYNETELKGRKLHVEISDVKSRNDRGVASTFNRGMNASPAPNAGSPAAGSDNQDAGSARSVTGQAERANYRDRTIALLNVPDTVSKERVQKLVESFGDVKKLTLRLDHGGAIVEFADVMSVGKAQLGLEGQELDERQIKIGTVPELLKQDSETHDDDGTWKSAKTKKSKPTGNRPTFGAPPMRPSQALRGGQRGGRKPGLGFSKRSDEAHKSNTAASGPVTAGPKSNDYFRQLMAKQPETEASPAAKHSDHEMKDAPEQKTLSDAHGKNGGVATSIGDEGDDEVRGDNAVGMGKDMSAAAANTDDDDGLLDDIMG